jgi:hypothetical protein
MKKAMAVLPLPGTLADSVPGARRVELGSHCGGCEQQDRLRLAVRPLRRRTHLETRAVWVWP